jgi:biopolymer transport protein ExbD
MRRHGLPETHVSHPNVTPLIDVVMCLIIFYMLVAKIGVKTGADLKIDLPVSLQGITIKDLGNTVTLNVSAGAQQPLVTLLNPRNGQVEELKIVEGTKKPLESFLKLLKGQNDKFSVIIRADQNLNYEFLEPVLFTCAIVKVREVNFATRKEQTVTTVAGN